MRKSRYFNGREFPDLDVNCFITLIDLENKVLDTNPGKAVGPDSVPPDIHSIAPTEVARILMPIALKCCGLISEPFQWSGGKYKELFKKIGKHHLVDSFRAMLLSDVLGKTVQGSLLAKTIDFASDDLKGYQFAGRAKRGCDLASHVARTMLDYGKTLNATFLRLFVDLKNVFWSLLRSVVLRYGETDDVFAYIVKDIIMPNDIPTDLLDILREPPHVDLPECQSIFRASCNSIIRTRG